MDKLIFDIGSKNDVLIVAVGLIMSAVPVDPGVAGAAPGRDGLIKLVNGWSWSH